MLILVAVTISMAIKGGLFENAGKVAKATQNAIDIEQELANGKIQIDGVWYDSIDEYINRNPLEKRAVLADEYGHSYTVTEAGKYYFYSYTYGQNFMSLFEVTEENGKLVANKLGEYSNETGISREEASAGGWIADKRLFWEGSICLSESTELAKMSPIDIMFYNLPNWAWYGQAYFLATGYYFCKNTDGYFRTYYVDEEFNLQELGDKEALTSDEKWIDLHQLAYSMVSS